MDAPMVFLAWSGQVEASAALDKALRIVKERLAARNYEIYNWAEMPHNRNINQEIEDKLRRADLLILEGSTDRPNPAFEMGFASYPALPTIVLKQEGSRELPADYGAPRYLAYPVDVGLEDGFKQFGTEFDALLERLERDTLSPGHRALRRSLGALVSNVLDTLNHYPDDHPHLYLLQGWTNALAADTRAGGASVLIADADYYVNMFSALQERSQLRFRAIADLTDNTELFWQPEHSEPLSAPGSERIFLIDWRLFFEESTLLAAYVEAWQDHLRANPDYSIYVVADIDLDSHLRHPLGHDAVGRHLLLVEPGTTFGGYRSRTNRDAGRVFCMEADTYRYNQAEKYYRSVRSKAVKLELDQEFLDLKRSWLTKRKIGYWGAEWTHQTERRSTRYFAQYDQHIRCWVPAYSKLITECAAMVAREILRVRTLTNRPVRMLEIGYGTGSLTAQVGPWISHLSEPFVKYGHLPPVVAYHAVDRADQMRQIADLKLHQAPGIDVTLLRQRAWDEVSTDLEYDVIFGSLIVHFMLDKANGNTATEFFAECTRRLAPHGSLVFADSFGSDDSSTPESIRAQWRNQMVLEGLSEEYADGFLDGNQDMLHAPSVAELELAAREHGFELAEARSPITELDLFKVVAFRGTTTGGSLRA